MCSNVTDLHKIKLIDLESEETKIFKRNKSTIFFVNGIFNVFVMAQMKFQDKKEYLLLFF